MISDTALDCLNNTIQLTGKRDGSYFHQPTYGVEVQSHSSWPKKVDCRISPKTALSRGLRRTGSAVKNVENSTQPETNSLVHVKDELDFNGLHVDPGSLSNDGASSERSSEHSNIQRENHDTTMTGIDWENMLKEVEARERATGRGARAVTFRNGPAGGKWTPEEDARLQNIVKLYGAKNWKQIAELLGKRRGEQCLHRWNKVLKPGLHKGPWTKEEDAIVLDMVQKHGIGKVKWSAVAAKLPGRIGKQCRERWHNHLDPDINKGEWTPEEDKIVFEAQAYFGNRWSEIARLLPGRTENAVKNRFNSSARKKWLEDQGINPNINPLKLKEIPNHLRPPPIDTSVQPRQIKAMPKPAQRTHLEAIVKSLAEQRKTSSEEQQTELLDKLRMLFITGKTDSPDSNKSSEISEEILPKPSPTAQVVNLIGQDNEQAIAEEVPLGAVKYFRYLSPEAQRSIVNQILTAFKETKLTPPTNNLSKQGITEPTPQSPNAMPQYEQKQPNSLVPQFNTGPPLPTGFVHTQPKEINLTAQSPANYFAELVDIDDMDMAFVLSPGITPVNATRQNNAQIEQQNFPQPLLPSQPVSACTESAVYSAARPLTEADFTPESISKMSPFAQQILLHHLSQQHRQVMNIVPSTLLSDQMRTTGSEMNHELMFPYLTETFPSHVQGDPNSHMYFQPQLYPSYNPEELYMGFPQPNCIPSNLEAPSAWIQDKESCLPKHEETQDSNSKPLAELERQMALASFHENQRVLHLASNAPTDNSMPFGY